MNCYVLFAKKNSAPLIFRAQSKNDLFNRVRNKKRGVGFLSLFSGLPTKSIFISPVEDKLITHDMCMSRGEHHTFLGYFSWCMAG